MRTCERSQIAIGCVCKVPRPIKRNLCGKYRLFFLRYNSDITFLGAIKLSELMLVKHKDFAHNGIYFVVAAKINVRTSRSKI